MYLMMLDGGTRFVERLTGYRGDLVCRRARTSAARSCVCVRVRAPHEHRVRQIGGATSPGRHRLTPFRGHRRPRRLRGAPGALRRDPRRPAFLRRQHRAPRPVYTGRASLLPSLSARGEARLVRGFADRLSVRPCIAAAPVLAAASRVVPASPRRPPPTTCGALWRPRFGRGPPRRPSAAALRRAEDRAPAKVRVNTTPTARPRGTTRRATVVHGNEAAAARDRPARLLRGAGHPTRRSRGLPLRRPARLHHAPPPAAARGAPGNFLGSADGKYIATCWTEAERTLCVDSSVAASFFVTRLSNCAVHDVGGPRVRTRPRRRGRPGGASADIIRLHVRRPVPLIRSTAPGRPVRRLSGGSDPRPRLPFPRRTAMERRRSAH